MFNSLFKKKYGLALGAGGAKGIVHIGVIKALEELNIKITHIGGSSIGSVVGGMYALWGDIQKIEDIILQYDSKDLSKLFRSDIGLSKGVLKGNSVLDELDKYLGDAKFSDCKMPFIAVSVDILSGKKIYHTKGLLKDALRASSSIPLVFKPYEFNGKYLVDGCLAEAVPVEATSSIGAKNVFGVNILDVSKTNETFNLKNLSMRVYQTSVYNIALKDLDSSDKSLSFDLTNISREELIDNAEEYIKLGYEETKKIFS
jgi:NTE family protein